jgi:predicted kinase
MPRRTGALIARGRDVRGRVIWHTHVPSPASDDDVVLVLMTGLPGTGKSTIADAVAYALGACVLSADPIDAALSTAGVSDEEGRVGYELMKALAREDLNAGRSVVVDAVNPFRFVRQAYRDLGDATHTGTSVIVTQCSDVALHRRRIEARHDRGEKGIDWAGVEIQIGYFERFEGECLVLDAVDPASENCAAAVSYVLGRSK